MARIIGDKPEKEIQAVCPHCRFRIAYVPNDVIRTQHTDYGGGTDDYFWVECPKCKEKFEVKQPNTYGRQ